LLCVISEDFHADLGSPLQVSRVTSLGFRCLCLVMLFLQVKICIFASHFLLQQVEAEQFTSATVFFSDIADFPEISVNSVPIDIIFFLNELYNFMDNKIVKYDVYKVEKFETSFNL
jgi:hypothetical protein